MTPHLLEELSNRRCPFAITGNTMPPRDPDQEDDEEDDDEDDDGADEPPVMREPDED